nr:hypothetical protein [Stenotrophomonas geniculata]
MTAADLSRNAHVLVLQELRSRFTESGSPSRTAALHAAISALASQQPAVDAFQSDVAEWMGQCFLPSLTSNMTERGDRLLEEVLELLQAHGYDSARVPTLVNYVFGRPVGEPAQEVGGVMVTLAAYCSVAGLSMQADGQAELDRINQPDVMARIRAKQEAKNELHFDTPLPGDAAQPSPTGQGDMRAQFEVWVAPRRVIHGFNRIEDMWDAWKAALAARQPVGQEPITVEAVATIFNHPEYGLSLDWLLENGIGELQVGDVLMVSDRSITDDDGSGEVYAAPPAQAVDLVSARDSIQSLLNWIDDWAETPEESGLDPITEKALEVVAQIDAQVYAREPNTAPNRLTDTEQANLFYIQDTRQFVGNCPMWWGPNGSGYVTRLDEAGRYTEQEAIRQNRTRETDIPWPCSEIDALARQTVDCQHMRPRAERLAELALIDTKAVGNG